MKRTMKSAPSLTTNNPFEAFFPPTVIAFVTDRSADFAWPPDRYEMTPYQQDFLRRIWDIDVSPGGGIHQVHEDTVVIADPKSRQVVEADAIITNVKNFSITVRTADCLSVFVYDPADGAIGLAHAGWKGTHKQIVIKMLAAMKEHYGTPVDQARVAFGPCIRAHAYEVGLEFKARFPDDVKEINGKYYFDLAAANRRQLLASGVRSENIYDCGICTFSHPQYFSYRRQGQAAGRMLSVMRISQ